MTSQTDETAQSTLMADIPYGQQTKITIERKGQIVLIGINRPYIDNRLDPEPTEGLARSYYAYDRDPSLRAAVLFGYTCGRRLATARGFSWIDCGHAACGSVPRQHP